MAATIEDISFGLVERICIFHLSLKFTPKYNGWYQQGVLSLESY